MLALSDAAAAKGASWYISWYGVRLSSKWLSLVLEAWLALPALLAADL